MVDLHASPADKTRKQMRPETQTPHCMHRPKRAKITVRPFPVMVRDSENFNMFAQFRSLSVQLAVKPGNQTIHAYSPTKFEGFFFSPVFVVYFPSPWDGRALCSIGPHSHHIAKIPLLGGTES